MITSLIGWSIRNRGLVLVATAGLILGGILAVRAQDVLDGLHLGSGTNRAASSVGSADANARRAAR